MKQKIFFAALFAGILLQSCSPFVYTEAIVEHLGNVTPQDSMSSITNNGVTGVYWWNSNAVDELVTIQIWPDDGTRFEYCQQEYFYTGNPFIELNHKALKLPSGKKLNLKLSYLVEIQVSSEDGEAEFKIAQRTYSTQFTTDSIVVNN